LKLYFKLSHYRILNDVLEIVINAETKDDFSAIEKYVNSLIFQRNQQNILLTKNISITDNVVICKIPLRKFNELENFEGVCKICFEIDNKDKIYISVYNPFEDDKYIYIGKDYMNYRFIKFLGKSNTLTIECINKESDIINLVIDKVNDLTNGFNIKGSIYPILINVNSFFFENKITNETIKLKMNRYDNGKLDADLDHHINLLSEEDWALYCSGTINEENVILKVNNRFEAKEVISTSLIDVKTFDNKLTIIGKATFHYMTNPNNVVNNVILIHRKTGIERSYSLTEKNFKEEMFFLEIDLENSDFINYDGIWDVYLGFEFNCIQDKIQLNIDSENELITEMLFLSKTVYNGEGTIKKLRPYITLDNNLALLINHEVLQGHIERIDYHGNKIELSGYFNIPDISFEMRDIYLKEVSTGMRIPLKNVVRKSEDNYAFISSYNWELFDYEKMHEGTFEVLINVQIRDHLFDLRLVSNMDDIREKSKAIKYPPLTGTFNRYPIKILPYYTEKNELLISISNSLIATCTNIKIGMKKTVISIEVNDSNLRLKDYQLLFVNHLEKEIKHAITGKVNEVKSKTVINFYLNKRIITEANLQAQNQLFLGVTINNKLFIRKIKGAKDIVDHNYTFISNAKKINPNLHYSIFFDKKSKNAFFEIRELKAHENKIVRIKYLLARIVAKSIKKFIKKDIWLIGENLGQVAQDNGFAFFEYCMKNNIPEKAYYISTKDNKNLNNLKPFLNKVVWYDSFKHFVLYCLSEYLIVSHGIRDVIPSIVHRRMGSNPKKVIYLQHGIIAMKRLGFNSKSYNGKIKKFVVSSKFEKEILIKDMGFRKDQVMVTGLARFDSLIDNSNNKATKEILIIPTWREWIIDSRKEFLESKFFKAYKELLEDKNLHMILEENNLIIKFYPHIEIQKKYKEDFKSSNKRVQIVNVGKENIKNLIQNSSIMITDYSSVAFDFNYLKKPVIFFHFDLDEYLSHRGSYINLRKDLIGDIATTKEDVINFIKYYLEKNFVPNPKNLIKSTKYYEFHDRNNAKRIYDEIKKVSKNNG